MRKIYIRQRHSLKGIPALSGVITREHKTIAICTVVIFQAKPLVTVPEDINLSIFPTITICVTLREPYMDATAKCLLI